MPEETWSEDVCTCGHRVSIHKDGEGRCDECDNLRHWQAKSAFCKRYQWNGKPRVRTW